MGNGSDADPGPPMTLGKRGGCPCSVDRVVVPLWGATLLRRVPGNAAIRSNPLRRHFVPHPPALRASGGEAAISEGGTGPDPAEMAERYGPETPVTMRIWS